MQKQLRLRQAKDFARLRREGHTYRHPFFIVSVATNGLSHNRYGFITAKKLGKAVTRNRVRRLLREAVRLLHPTLLPGYDVVIVARAHAIDQPFEELQRAAYSMFKKAAIVKD